MSVICPKNYGSCGVNIDYDPHRLFVLMPFSEQVSPQSLFFDVLQSLPGWDVHRADSDLSKPEIWCKICSNIQSSRAIIADLSGANPNVFLELGLTWGLGKSFILLTQDVDKLPFDTRSYHVIKYERQKSEVINSEAIRKSVTKALNDLPSLNPILDAETPEIFLNKRIREAKKKMVHYWRLTNDGFQIENIEKAIYRLGLSLLRNYPIGKSINQIAAETNISANTIRAYVSSNFHGFSQYFTNEKGLVQLSNDGINWLLDEVVTRL